MQQQQRSRKDIRERILQAADALFLAQGYRMTSIDAIAAQAQVTKRTLYKYFPTKLTLLMIVVEQHTQVMDALCERYINDPREMTKELFIEILENLFRLFKEHDAFMLMLWGLDSQEFEGGIPGEFITHAQMMFTRTRNLYIQLYGKAADAGLLRVKNIDMFVHMMSAINKGVFLHAEKEGRFEVANIDVDDLFHMTVDLYLHGIFVD